MPYSLIGRNVLVTGGSRGLGAEIVRKFAAQGSNIAINYVNNEGPAQKLAQELRSSYNVNIAVVQADASSTDQVQSCVRTAISALGGLDIVIANAGWTRFADFADLDALSDEEWNKCWRMHVLGIKHLVSSSMPTFKANPEGGVVLVTSSIAGRNLNGSSLAYSVTKAAQLHLVKCVAKTQGAKLRANAVLPGLLLTEWGQQFGKERIEVLQKEAVLKQETNIQDCADMYVSLAKNTSITGQHIQVDSGLVIQHL